MPHELTVGDIAFYTACAFLFGVLAASLTWNGIIVIVMVLVLVIVLVALAPTFRGMSEYGKLAVILLGATLTGMFYYHAYVDIAASHTHLPFGKAVSFSAVIVDEPKASGKFDVLSASAEIPFSGTISIFADPGSDFHYGDEVRVAGTIEPPRQLGDDPAIFPKAIYLISAHHGFWLREILIDFKSDVSKKFDAVLSSDESALLAGIVTGGTNGMTADLKSEMSISGTSYIATMYGYKISVIVFVIVELLGGFIARRVRVAGAIAIIVLFVLMVGLEPSAVRAGIMACMALIAREIGRPRGMRNAITLTATGMALWNPTLLMQASFTLSFASLLGIMYLGPALTHFFGWDGPRAKIDGWGLRSAVIVPTASLLAILPITVATFGQFSLLAFISNMLIFPTIPLAMFLGCLIACLAVFSLFAAFLIAKIASAVLWYELAVIRLFSVVTFPIPAQLGQFFWAAFYYAALTLFMYRYSPP